MYKLTERLTQMDIQIDIDDQKKVLVELINNMEPENLWRLQVYTYLMFRKPKGPQKPLPVGISDYCIASTSYYYVDKTMMIKEFLDERPMVSLFLRPRRFGKTLNMDMLRVFFEKTDEDTSHYFEDKLIWSCGESYQKHQGKYPVIFVSFKDVKFRSWEDSFSDILDVLSEEFDRHPVLLTSTRCTKREKRYFQKVIDKDITEAELTGAFRKLTQMLHKHYGVAPILIVDEYDTPIQQGYVHGFYDEVVLFMRNLFSGGLKDNHHLSYGFLTGILRVAKESIFSGMNNLKINSILDNRYAQYFGFTENEIREMCLYYNVPYKYKEIKEWYNGYLFGNTNIYNPWSVINYFSNDCSPSPFWLSTGSNEIIKEILENATEEVYENLQMLLQGKKFLTYVDTSVIYPQIKRDPSSAYSFLLVAGYLKPVTVSCSAGGDYLCEVALPNKEIAYVYNKEVLSNLRPMISQTTAAGIQKAILSQNVGVLKSLLRKLLLHSVSYFDTMGELFYHGLLLGLCAVLDNRYYVSSNRESGLGRYDIALFPRGKGLPGIILELKAQKDCSCKELKKLAEEALEQILNKKYDTAFARLEICEVLYYGVAFSGKNVEVAEQYVKAHR